MTVAAINTPAASTISQLETQLSSIITSAKEISIVAEELLREFSTLDSLGQNDAMPPARLRQTIQAAAVAPRLLSATLQQLDALNSMLQMD